MSALSPPPDLRGDPSWWEKRQSQGAKLIPDRGRATVATWVERTTWSDGRRCSRASPGPGVGPSSRKARPTPPSASSARWSRARRRSPSRHWRPTGGSGPARRWPRRRRWTHRPDRRLQTTIRLSMTPPPRRTRRRRRTPAAGESARRRMSSRSRRRRRRALRFAARWGARTSRIRTCDGSRWPPSSRRRSRRPKHSPREPTRTAPPNRPVVHLAATTNDHRGNRAGGPKRHGKPHRRPPRSLPRSPGSNTPPSSPTHPHVSGTSTNSRAVSAPNAWTIYTPESNENNAGTSAG